MRLRVAVLGVVGVAMLVLSACGGSPRPAATASTPGGATTTSVMPTPIPITTPTTAVAARPGTSILPDLTVDNVAGGTVNLASLAPSPHPVLLWFWAPT